MNVSKTYLDESEIDYKVDFDNGHHSSQNKPQRKPSYSVRKKSRPKQFNGIHRRRRKSAR